MTLNSNDAKIVQIANGALATQNWELFEEVYPMLKSNGHTAKVFGCPEYAAELRELVNQLLYDYQQAMMACDDSHWVATDGGRKAAGFDGDAGDCGVRAVAVVTDLSYRDAHSRFNYDEESDEGLANMSIGEFLRELGWSSIPLQGKGMNVREAAQEFGNGLIIAKMLNYGHFVGIRDSKYHDTWNSGELRAECIHIPPQQ